MNKRNPTRQERYVQSLISDNECLSQENARLRSELELASAAQRELDTLKKTLENSILEIKELKRKYKESIHEASTIKKDYKNKADKLIKQIKNSV